MSLSSFFPFSLFLSAKFYGAALRLTGAAPAQRPQLDILPNFWLPRRSAGAAPSHEPFCPILGLRAAPHRRSGRAARSRDLIYNSSSFRVPNQFLLLPLVIGRSLGASKAKNHSPCFLITIPTYPTPLVSLSHLSIFPLLILFSPLILVCLVGEGGI